jgi:murein DD-endopeptidase MepM/ murein hydrolase activator NlpD
MVFVGNGGTKSTTPPSKVHVLTATVGQPTAEPTKSEQPATETPVPTAWPEEITITPVEPTETSTPKPAVATKTPTAEPTLEPTKPPINPSDPASLVNAAQEFLDERGAATLLADQAYWLAHVDGPTQGWVVFTTAFSDKAWPEGIGSGGFVTIGHLEGGQLAFRLPSDDGFIDWVRQLPSGLLPESLREWYDPTAESSLEESSLSALDSTQPPPLYLPYPAGAKYQITALPGSENHSGSHQYAIDFGLPEGAPIAASAGGKVLSFKDDSNTGGCDGSYDQYANYIMIEITPGDDILYLHLQQGSVTANKIQVGQVIEAGQIIGAAGSTGFTCGNGPNGRGAHLHIERSVPYNNLKRIKNSAPLNFVEFGPADPRARVDYVSQNLSPEQRRAAEEEKRRQEQLTAEEKAKQPILTAFENFNKVYWCSRVKGCSEADITEELKYVTEKLRASLFDIIFCFFCPSKDDKLESYGEAEYISFPVPTPEDTNLEIRVKSASRATVGEEVTYHFTVTNVFFVKEGDRWKVDGFEITCGYVTNEIDGKPGEVIYTENLEGCEWQPPSSGSW